MIDKAKTKGKVAGGDVNKAKPEVDEEARRAELTAEAIDLGLEVTGEESLDELEKAVAEAKDEQGESDDPDAGKKDTAKSSKTPAKAKAKTNIDSGSVDIVVGDDPDAEYIRTYSEDVHGEGYREMAAEMAGKKEGRRIVESDTIPQVTVEYREYDKEKKDTVDKVRKFSERDGADFKEAAIEFNMQVRGTIRAK